MEFDVKHIIGNLLVGITRTDNHISETRSYSLNLYPIELSASYGKKIFYTELSISIIHLFTLTISVP